MFYDLNVPWTTDYAELQRTLGFLAELDYDVVALNHIIKDKLPADLTCPIPDPLPFPMPPKLKVLRRCTLVLSDAAQNHRLSQLSAQYDILALRPTEESILMRACTGFECDLISLDMSQRFPFHFKLKMLASALQRGVRLEMCYAQGLTSGGGGESIARRNLTSNATGLIRASRSRGLVISSEATKALACRGPWDVVNLAAVWGLSPERGREAVGREARAVVMQAEMKRRSFRGVIDVIYGGEPPEKASKEANKPNAGKNGKRKAEAINDNPAAGAGEVTLSKREKKRRAKQAKLETEKASDVNIAPIAS